MINVNIDRILNINDDGLLKGIIKGRENKEGKTYNVTSVSHNWMHEPSNAGKCCLRWSIF